MNYKTGIKISLFCHILIIISFVILDSTAFKKEWDSKYETCV